MNDLADFLLARIAEDTAHADGCQNWTECGSGDWEATDETYGCPAHPSTSRRIAECNAKRLIVEGLRMTAVGSASPWDGCGDDCEFKEAWWVLRHLAAPYASHPEFRQEWKP